MRNHDDVLLKLRNRIQEEKLALDAKIKKNYSPYLFIDTIRALDFYYLAKYDKKQEFESFIRYGFPKFLEQFYLIDSNKYNVLPLYTSTDSSLIFCHYHLVQYGKLRVAERFCELAGVELVKLNENSPNNFHISTSVEDFGPEFLDNKSISEFFNSVFNELLSDEKSALDKRGNEILNLLDKQVKTWRTHFVRYGSSPEIDEYYYKRGNIELFSSQLFDDFSDDHEFGGIKYKQFLDVVKSLIGVSLKHRDACQLLINKNPKIALFNNLTLPQIHSEVIEQYSQFLNIDSSIVFRIMEILTVSSANINGHLKSDRSFSPLFIKMGDRFVIRSFRGCMYQPIQFLHDELKRLYEKDYTRGFNERESTFRNQLYGLFKEDRFFKVDRNIVIKSNIHTDIDAIIFDKKTKSLGLFQLKWQDKFSSDVKSRKSRISNFYPKANEWINKISIWLGSNSASQIMSSFNIPEREINKVYLFVIGRYNTNFGKESMDERAAWGSWYHVINTIKEIRPDFDDQIRELYFRLKIRPPEFKKLGKELEKGYTISFNSFRLNFGSDN